MNVCTCEYYVKRLTQNPHLHFFRYFRQFLPCLHVRSTIPASASDFPKILGGLLTQ